MSKKTFAAWRSSQMFENGVGYVMVTRQKTSGAADTVSAGVFLVDTYCLGVKNAFLTKFPLSRLNEMLEQIFPEGKTALSAACGRKLIEDAIAYAASCGLGPHEDYQAASHVLSGIDANQCDTTFTFGKDGKPFYIQGPNDTPEFAQRVLASLRQHAGPPGEKFDYIVLAGEGFGGNPEDREADAHGPGQNN